jgi:hypothetical protein
MEQKNVSYFWKILDRFNFLMKESIEGPNCTNSEICRGDCCSIKIDVPKVLAQWYIDNGYAEETDFIRSNIFSFHLRFDLNTGKCFLFDKHKNGCIVHNSGRKPPQCWIYPTGFFNSSNDTISCKKVGGWKIKNLEYTKEAEKLLKKYVILCHGEALEEQTKIKERLKYSISMEKQKNNKSLPSSLKRISPSKLGGFKDSWNSIKYLSAEGYSLQMKKFCERFNNDCEFLKTNFLDCEHICDKIITKLIDYLNYYILDYIRNKGADPEGEYPLFKLFNYISI